MPGRAEALLQQVIKGGKWLKSKDEINWSEALLERLWLPGWHIWRIKSEKEKEKSCFTFDLQLSYLKGCKVKIHWHILWRPETECFYSAGYRNVSLKRSSNPKSAPRPKYTNQTWNVSPLRRHVSAQSYFLVLKQDASGYMQRFTVAFCFVCVHTSLALTTHKPLLPMWLLYTQLAQLPPACATAHQQMGAFQSCRGTCCSLQIHGAEHYFLCLWQIASKPLSMHAGDTLRADVHAM